MSNADFCAICDSLLKISSVGAVLENDIYYNESSRMLLYAVEEANEKILLDAGMKLAVEIETISYGQEYTVSKRACNLLEVSVCSSRRSTILLEYIQKIDCFFVLSNW